MGLAVGVVLLTKNAGPLLREVLTGLKQQEVEFELIAVDSGSQDSTLELLKKNSVKVIEIAPSAFNHGPTRNLGASFVSDDIEYIAFLSQDAVPQPGWLEALVRPMEEDPHVAGVFSRQVPREGCNPILKRYMLHEWEQCGGMKRIEKKISDPEDYATRRKWYTAFNNTSSCVRAEVFKKITFRPAEFGEDRLWAGDVLEAGYQIIYEPRSAVIHSHNYSLMEQLRQNFDDAEAADSPIKAGKHDLNKPFRLFKKIAKDLIFIWGKEPLYLSGRLKWSFYLPFWHLATLTGVLLGRRKGRLPRKMEKFLSRQYRIKAV